MTQVEGFAEDSSKKQSSVAGGKTLRSTSTSGIGAAVSVNAGNTKTIVTSCRSSAETHLSRLIRVYQNGRQNDYISIPLPLNLCRVTAKWSDVLEFLDKVTKLPITQVFTTNGKKLSTAPELDGIREIVISMEETESFKTLSYGRDSSGGSISSFGGDKKTGDRSPVIPPPSTSGRSSIKGKPKRSDRSSLANSVVMNLDTSTINADQLNSISTSTSNNYHPVAVINPLMKTLSEQDVSSLDKSPKVRTRQAHSPKPRPISAYHQHANNMSNSADRRQLGLSRIPKRIVSNSNSPQINYNHQNLQNNTPVHSNSHSPSVMINSAPTSSCTPSQTFNIKPRRIESKTTVPTTATERTSRQDIASRNEFVRPRLVTVIRHGMKPRKAVRFLLNKKTARSYDQVLNELTESIKPSWGAVRRVFTLNGSEVTCLEEFFGNEDIFLACPNDRLGTNDFDLDSEECKSIQPYVKVSLACKQSRFKGLEASRSPNRRPKSSSSPQNHMTNSQYPSHPKYIPLAHFPSSIIEKYFIGDIIGDGNFAVVRECTDRLSKGRFALKVIDKSKCKGRDAPPEHEVKILNMVNHPNIIEMYEQYDFSNELYIVLELIEGGDLFDAIAEVTKFSEQDSASMTRDIASALNFLHSLRIIHRDIKPENLLVYSHSDGQRRIKLGDFGLAKLVDGPLFTVCGTPTYVAPEILAESGYGLKVDIWALGVIVYVLLCGYPPFVSPTGEQEGLFDLILTADYDFPDEHWDIISDSAKDIITRMIDPDVDMRLSADEVLDHPWLAMNATEVEDRHRSRTSNRYGSDLQFRVFEAMGLNSLMSSGTTPPTTTNTIPIPTTTDSYKS